MEVRCKGVVECLWVFVICQDVCGCFQHCGWLWPTGAHQSFADGAGYRLFLTKWGFVMQFFLLQLVLRNYDNMMENEGLARKRLKTQNKLHWITHHSSHDSWLCPLHAGCLPSCLLVAFTWTGDYKARVHMFDICWSYFDSILTHSQQRAKWNKHIHDSILCGLVCDLPNMYKISCVRNKKRSSKWQIDNHRHNTYIIWMAGSRFVFASEVICWDAFALALPATFCSAAGRHAPCSSLLEATEPWDPRGPDLVLFWT